MLDVVMLIVIATVGNRRLSQFFTGDFSHLYSGVANVKAVRQKGRISFLIVFSIILTLIAFIVMIFL